MCVNKAIQGVFFPSDIFSPTPLRFIQAVSCIYRQFFLYCCLELHEYTTIYLPIISLIDIWFVSSLGL